MQELSDSGHPFCGCVKAGMPEEMDACACSGRERMQDEDGVSRRSWFLSLTISVENSPVTASSVNCRRNRRKPGLVIELTIKRRCRKSYLAYVEEKNGPKKQERSLSPSKQAWTDLSSLDIEWSAFRVRLVLIDDLTSPRWTFLWQ
ncbi:hypothetical protein RvY_02710 [Ramazzottius varieornatus]|uniref:Uncharacterized protein n=1 Tax=Ramazzottius varieornatus TaxID=947166 RepID=A0A1D1URG7_RAMVA|nr:hypothetical protein RvY_02710 [Ramazzottius varieornatus]